MKSVVTRIIVLLLFFALGCTENPLFKDNQIEGNSIKGKVLLKDKQTDHVAYVWLEGFDIGTFTDKDGDFQLDLSTSKQGGLSGQYKLYFYVNNYQPDSASVLIHNGNVQPDAGDLDKKYRLRETVTLSKILDIETVVTPNTISADFDDILHVTVTLTAYQDTVRITTKIRDATVLTSAFIREIGNETQVQLIDDGGTTYSQLPIRKEYDNPDFKRRFFMTIPFEAVNFTPGEYEMIPYLLVTPLNIPAALFNSLMRDQTQLSPDFLNIPISENSGFFQIK